MNNFFLLKMITLLNLSFSTNAYPQEDTNIIDESGYKQGEWIYHSKNSNVMNGDSIIICNYLNDTLHGDYKGFIKKQLYYQGSYCKGRKTGLEFLYGNEVLNRLNFYTEYGLSYSLAFFNNGALRNEYHYTSGLKDGLGVEYHTNGKKSCLTTYKNGKIIGKQFYFNKRGKIYYIMIYENDIYIDFKKYLFPRKKEK
jgi:antitoxin component YwqK of YwqJK toxin-antitoxin module